MEIKIIFNELFNNALFKGLGIPIILTILAAMVEVGSSIAKGVGKGEFKFRIWIRQQIGNQLVLASVSRQSVALIKKSKNLVDIEPMYSIDVLSLSSIAIDLGIGALATDISFLLNGSESSLELTVMLLLHFCFLVIISILLALTNLNSPEEKSEKIMKARVAITLGFISILSAFLYNLI